MNSFFPISLPGVVAGKIRDLNYFCFNDMLLVFACDSDGGVGPLPKDESYRSAEIAGKMYPKCVLMELLACGAEIIAVYNDFCYEESNCNREICDSITDLVVSVGYDPSIVKNSFGTYTEPLSTAYGITAVGVIRKGALRVCSSKNGDIICAIGIPSERMSFDRHMKPTDVKLLRDQAFIHEILPCGSHGIRKEAEDLAADSNLVFVEYADHLLYSEGTTSCGASAVVLVTLSPGDLERLQKLDIDKPVTVIGELRGKGNICDVDALGSNMGWVLTEDGEIILDNGWVISSIAALSYAKGHKEDDNLGYIPPKDTVCKLATCAIDKLKILGKEPLLVINDLNFGMKTGGKETIEALQKLVKLYGMDPPLQLTGSTEDNHIAIQSGYAMRVFGVSRKLP